MTFWLDWKLFGNGRGMASPYFDDTFYWLVDTLHHRKLGRGRFYRSISGLGAQLESFEWFAPPAGTRRKLFGHEFVVFNTTRTFLRVRVSWALAASPGHPAGVKDFAQVRDLHRQLREWGHGVS